MADRRTIMMAVATATMSALVACGGDTGVDPEADEDAAETAVAAFEDELDERGFEVQADDDDGDDDLVFESEDCEEFDEAFGPNDEALPGETASVESDDFERGELDLEGGAVETAVGSVGFVEEQESADEAFDLLADDRLGPCMEEAFRIEFAEDDGGLSVGEFDVDTDDLGVGDESLILDMSTTLEAGEASFPFVVEVAFARSGRTLALVFLGVVGADEITEDPEDLLELLLEEAGAST